MNKRVGRGFAVIGLLSIVGCAGESARSKVFFDPTAGSRAFKTIAMLPVYGPPLSASEKRDIGRSIAGAVAKRYPGCTIVPPQEVEALVDQAKLTDDYQKHLQSMATTGMGKPEVIRKIADTTKADALLEIDLLDVRRSDGAWGKQGRTSITLRAALLAGADDTLMWEITAYGESHTENGSAFSSPEAPPVWEAVDVATRQIVDDLSAARSDGGESRRRARWPDHDRP